MSALDRVCDLLDQHSIRYALIGAAALAAHGVARSTFDIDLLTTNRRALDADIWTTLADTVDVRRGDVDDPLAGVVRVTADSDRPVDLVVGKHAWQTRAVDRARPIGDRAPVVLVNDLILLKLYAGGAQDLWDIQELLRHSGPAVAIDVTNDLMELPRELRDRWESIHR